MPAAARQRCVLSALPPLAAVAVFVLALSTSLRTTPVSRRRLADGSGYDRVRYSLGDLFNMPVFGGEHRWENQAERWARRISKELPDSVVAYYFKKETAPAELPRSARSAFPNLEQIVHAVNHWGAAHMLGVDDTVLLGHARELRKPHALAVHIRSGDKGHTSPSHMASVAQMAHLFDRLFVFGGLHNDTGENKAHNLTFADNELTLNGDIAALVGQLPDKNVTVLNHLSPDMSLFLMGQASTLFAHRGGFSMLAALVCGRNNGTVLYTDDLSWWSDPEIWEYIPRAIHVSVRKRKR